MGFFSYKLNLPKAEGLKCAITGGNEFANASIAQDTDVKLSYISAFGDDDDFYGFEEDADMCEDDIDTIADNGVDINTIPARDEESDQFSSEDEEQEIGSEKFSAEELADDDSIDESFIDTFGWDDLF